MKFFQTKLQDIILFSNTVHISLFGNAVLLVIYYISGNLFSGDQNQDGNRKEASAVLISRRFDNRKDPARLPETSPFPQLSRGTVDGLQLRISDARSREGALKRGDGDFEREREGGTAALRIPTSLSSCGRSYFHPDRPSTDIYLPHFFHNLLSQ